MPDLRRIPLPRRRAANFRLAAIPAALFCLFSGHALAQTPAEIAQEGIRRQEERTRQQLEQLGTKPDLLQPAAAVSDDAALPVETPCFVIHKITVGDGRQFGAMASITGPYLGRCIGIQGLRKIAARLDAALIAQGYATTRVSLPKQNLSEGTLAFTLHTGRVAEVRMVQPGGEPDTAWGTWRNAFPLDRGDILNIRDLEQGVEQMKRLTSQSVTTRIEPGAELDTSVVVIERQSGALADRVHGSLTLDNSGSDALGRPQLSGSVSIDNPAGLNDLFSLSGNINAQQPKHDHRSVGLAASYSIPWDYHTLNVSLSKSRFAQFVQGTTARFLSSGSSESAETKWHYLAWRSMSAKAGLYGALSTRRARSFLDDVELVVQRRRTSSGQAGVTWKQFVGQASIDIDLGYRKGLSLGGAEEDLPSAAEGGVTLRPAMLSLNASFSQPLQVAGRPLQHNISLRAQKTRDTTLSIDQISIGGRYSVRGFDGDSVLMAENGVVLRNDLSTPLPVVAGIASTVFVAVDAGKVSGPSAANLAGTALAGAALGVRGRWKGLVFDVSVATPLSKPDKFHSRRLNPYLSITYSL